MAAVAAIVAAGGREGGMFVPGAPHLGGSARTRAGRGSVLTIYVYMPLNPILYMCINFDQ